MKRYTKFLLGLRAWIDSQVSRDVLQIEVRINGRLYFKMNHQEALANVKQCGGTWEAFCIRQDGSQTITLEMHSSHWDPY